MELITSIFNINKKGSESLDCLIKTINRNIVISFLIILIFFVVAISALFIEYKISEEKDLNQRVNTILQAFATQTSQKLTTIAALKDFKKYLQADMTTRKKLYKSLLAAINDLNFTGKDKNTIAGMTITDSGGVNIFTSGIKTDEFVVLNLWRSNEKSPKFDIGARSYHWKIYFRREDIVKELKRYAPDLEECIDCNTLAIIGEHFSGFQVAQVSGMKFGLTIKSNSPAILWEMMVFVISSLLVLVAWNINRIKILFKKYLSDPIIEMTAKIRENKSLPTRATVSELLYLAEQIDQWKKQVIELETIKAQEKTKEEKIKTMQSIGASIAHELRTPLRSIMSGVSGIEKFLPVLLENNELARKHNLPGKIIRPHQLKLLQGVLSNLKAEGALANTIIDMFLVKIRGVVAETVGLKKMTIAECVSESLRRYVFQEQEKNLIVCDLSRDFQFMGDKLLVVHIMFNLLKNALYYIADAQKGKIYIHTFPASDGNRLHFKDTGKGINKSVLPQIFDRFYSKTAGGVGIGLSFCKMAMQWMGGDITCQSAEGEYAEFILHFPHFKE